MGNFRRQDEQRRRAELTARWRELTDIADQTPARDRWAVERQLAALEREASELILTVR